MCKAGALLSELVRSVL